MIVSDIIKILDADVILEGDLNAEIKTACGSDMMSDVLAFVKDQSVLLTGLVNPQVVRTADMMDMVCIVFVRGKMPDQTIIGPGQSQGHHAFENAPADVYRLRPVIFGRIAGRL